MNINQFDYEQPRKLFELCDWISVKLQEMEQQPDFEVIYFERVGQNIKKFLEEAIPVAKLGLYFWQPWRTISITCLAGNEAHDAVIQLTGANQTEEIIKVEVTCTETPETTMRRQALARNGMVFFTGQIRREGRTIHTEPSLVDVDEECKRILDVAFNRFRTKAEQESDPQTAILVYVNTYRLLPAYHRHQLIERTKRYLLQHHPTLYGVYYCYHPEPGFDGLRNDIYELR